MAKSAREKLNAKKEAKKVVLTHSFAGGKEGQLMFVGTPGIIADYIEKIPYGETRTVEKLRGDLARRRKCDVTCPMSTAIFVRIAAEAALEDLADGKSAAEITPFWRLIDGQHKIAKKLDVDSAWINEQRELEAAGD